MKKNKMIAMMMAVTVVCTAFTGCGNAEPASVTESTEAGATEPTAALEEKGSESVEESQSKEESQPETESESQPESQSETENNSEPESQHETESKPEQESQPETESKPEPESNTDSQSESTTNTDSSGTAETAALPGINRNGRYPDIPETVLPSNIAATVEFVDEPIFTEAWWDVNGKIYADYMRTEVIKVAEYDVDELWLIAYCAEDEANGIYGNAIVIYNGQYAIINETAFAIWTNGVDPEYN